MEDCEKFTFTEFVSRMDVKIKTEVLSITIEIFSALAKLDVIPNIALFEKDFIENCSRYEIDTVTKENFIRAILAKRFPREPYQVLFYRGAPLGNDELDKINRSTLLTGLHIVENIILQYKNMFPSPIALGIACQSLVNAYDMQIREVISESKADKSLIRTYPLLEDTIGAIIMINYIASCSSRGEV